MDWDAGKVPTEPPRLVFERFTKGGREKGARNNTTEFDVNFGGFVRQVKLKCGKETVVMSTTEPSRCEYLMEFTTPALCQDPKTLDPMLHTEL